MPQAYKASLCVVSPIAFAEPKVCLELVFARNVSVGVLDSAAALTVIVIETESRAGSRGDVCANGVWEWVLVFESRGSERERDGERRELN